MEMLEIAHKIEEKITLLEKGRGVLNETAQKKAETLATYDKAKEMAIIKLKSDGIPITLIPDLAKGQCWKERQEMDLAESMYRIAIVKIESIQTELNGYQSVFKHLENL